jgi:hypothetical protein
MFLALYVFSRRTSQNRPDLIGQSINNNQPLLLWLHFSLKLLTICRRKPYCRPGALQQQGSYKLIPFTYITEIFNEIYLNMRLCLRIEIISMIDIIFLASNTLHVLLMAAVVS